MAKQVKIIRVPQPPRTAYNKHRPVSELLWTQVEHLAAVVQHAIDEERRAVRTESDASAFLRKYTAFLHPQLIRNNRKTRPHAPAKRRRKQ